MYVTGVLLYTLRVDRGNLTRLHDMSRSSLYIRVTVSAGSIPALLQTKYEY